MDKKKNIKLEGNGAKIVMHPAFEFAVIRQSENIEISGFTVMHDPLPYFQGSILSYNLQPGNLSMDIEVPQRYVLPKTGKWLGRRFSRGFWETPGLSRVGGSLHLYIDRIESLDATGRRLRCPIQFMNCYLDNIHFWIYSGQDRSRPHGVVFEDCYIWDRLTLNVDNAWDISFKRCTLDKTILDLDGVPNAAVEDVQWINSTQEIVRLENGSNLHISGHTTRNGQPSLAPWIRGSGSTVRYEGMVNGPEKTNSRE